MSDQIKIAIVSFGRGMATFIRPWRFVNSVPSKPQEKRGIGTYFARVGYRLRKATDRYAEMHPEIPVNAN